MTTRHWTVLIAVGALGVAGCGGSGHLPVANPPKTTTSGAAGPQPATTVATGTQTTAPTSTTAHSATPPKRDKDNAILAARVAERAAQRTAVPPVSGAMPARGFIGSCMAGNGLGQPQLLRPNEWRAVAALEDKPIYVDGPYVSTAQAISAAQSLAGIESVAAGGHYVVSSLLAYHVTPYVNALAKCLAAAGNQPSGQKPIRF